MTYPCKMEIIKNNSKEFSSSSLLAIGHHIDNILLIASKLNKLS